MFAVVKTGGKQYKVTNGDVIKVEKLEGEVGSSISLDSVMMVHAEGKTSVGSPFVEGASVSAEVVSQERDKKVIVFKKKRRQNYRRTKGHRQTVTILRIQDIKAK